MIQHVAEVIPQTLERLGLAERVWCARAALHWPTVAEKVRRGAAKASTARARQPRHFAGLRPQLRLAD